jgi:hypothetical protein
MAAQPTIDVMPLGESVHAFDACMRPSTTHIPEMQPRRKGQMNAWRPHGSACMRKQVRARRWAAAASWSAWASAPSCSTVACTSASGTAGDSQTSACSRLRAATLTSSHASSSHTSTWTTVGPCPTSQRQDAGTSACKHGAQQHLILSFSSTTTAGSRVRRAHLRNLSHQGVCVCVLREGGENGGRE